nr:MAG TPA: hypothetical protein [Caudoviricetes sp.]
MSIALPLFWFHISYAATSPTALTSSVNYCFTVLSFKLGHIILFSFTV